MESLKCKAPWTDDHVASLNAYQASGVFPRFRCRCGGHLVATTLGWWCEPCQRIAKDWCHAWMADWSWLDFQPAISARALAGHLAQLRTALGTAASALADIRDKVTNWGTVSRPGDEFIARLRQLAGGEGGD